MPKITRVVGQCESLRWTWDFVMEEFDPGIFADMGDPWRPREVEREKEQRPALNEGRMWRKRVGVEPTRDV